MLDQTKSPRTTAIVSSFLAISALSCAALTSSSSFWIFAFCGALPLFAVASFASMSAAACGDQPDPRPHIGQRAMLHSTWPRTGALHSSEHCHLFPLFLLLDIQAELSDVTLPILPKEGINKRPADPDGLASGLVRWEGLVGTEPSVKPTPSPPTLPTE